MLQGAIFGAIGGVIGVIIVLILRSNKFNKIMKSVREPGVIYSAPFYYASSGRYQKAMKIYDSYGALYIIGNKAYFKTNSFSAPWVFDMAACKVQQEADWRKLKWFSITTATGEKYYFDSYRMGAVSNNSAETLKALGILQSLQTSHSVPPPPPPPPKV